VVVNELIEASDLVLALGVKFSHNGSLGFALRLPRASLVHVDAARDVLGQSYPADLEIEADVPVFLAALLEQLGPRRASRWTKDGVGDWRRRLGAAVSSLPEPRLAAMEPRAVFAALRAAVPDATVVTTDSGLHQYLVRRHLPVLAPRSLLVPSDFQSMGFGLSAAIGASLAMGATAVAVIGDGGFAISGLELATAVDNRIPVVVVVLVDRAFGLIRLQQLRRTGHESGVAIPSVDPGLVATAVGAEHRLLEGDADAIFAAAVEAGGVTVVEVPVEDAGGLARARVQGLVRRSAGGVLGPKVSGAVSNVLRRRRT
jgi:acetolactate synthase-1/2/3 large subunit